MDEKRQKELLEKLKRARSQRYASGLTQAQINSLNNPTAKHYGPSKRVVRDQRNRNNAPKKVIRPEPPRLVPGVFISGGIGDVLAIEAYMPQATREALTTIFYGTNKETIIRELFTGLSSFPKLKNHTTVWNDFSSFWCFFTKSDCIHKLINHNKHYPRDLRWADDYSILPVFESIRAGTLTYNRSSFLLDQLAEVDKFDLPERYFVVCPYSTDKRLKGRDFDSDDWRNCLEMIKDAGVMGVILNEGHDKIPDHPKLVNLNNKTKIKEAIEILKKAEGYIGIDSSLSVLAAKLFNPPKLAVKSINQHCYENLDCYYAPKTDFSFVRETIRT